MRALENGVKPNNPTNRVEIAVLRSIEERLMKEKELKNSA